MVAKLLVWELLLVSFFVWKCNGSHDEDSATKKIDEMIEKIASSLAGNDECKDMELPGDCTITDDCLKITCNAKFGGKYTTLTVTTNRCDEPVTITINIKVKEEDVDWTHVFTSGSEIPVPGLAVDVPGVVKAGVFIKTEIKSEDGKLTLKVTLEGGTKVGDISFFPLKLPIVVQKLPVSTDYCDFVRWWEARNTAERVVMILVMVLLALSIISGCWCCCCCCCCRPCKKRRSARVV